MFEFSTDLLVDQNIKLSSLFIEETLRPLLTPSRVKRIDQVTSQRLFRCFPVLEGLYDQGNISAVLRSTEALGFGQASVIECATRFKQSRRTTAGADKWVEITRYKTTQAAIESFKKNKIQIVSTALVDHAIPIDNIDFSKPTALIFGNEKHGVSPEMIAASDFCTIIPMTGFVQSFNISVAASLALYTAQNKLRSHLQSSSDLSKEDQQILRALYMMRTLDTAKETLIYHAKNPRSNHAQR